MRILIATSYIQLVGGIQTYLKALIPSLIKNGHCICVLHEYPKVGSTCSIFGDDYQPELIFTKGSTLSEIREKVRQWRPEVIYNQGLKDTRLESLLADEFPLIFYAHSSYGNCISGFKFHSRGNKKLCTDSFSNKCLFKYFTRGCGGNNPITALNLYKKSVNQKKNLQKYKYVLVNSNWMYSEIGGLAIKSEVLPLFPTFFQPSLYSPKPLACHYNSLLFSGRISPSKGFEHAILAVEEASKEIKRPIKLVVVGGGEGENRLKKLISRAKIDIVYKGWISSDKLADEYSKTDALIVPSLWGEPFGLVGIEAGCFGTPSVGYRVGGISDWLIPGQTGECGPVGDVSISILISSIVKVMTDIDWRNKLGHGAWELSKKYSLSNHLERLEKVMESLL